jgi:hypothetical protein
MPNRAERRAAERAAQKAARAQNPSITQPAAEPTQPIEQTQAAAAASESFEQQPITASEAQIRANRENAQKSTGPTSPAGREKVSHNRRVHGLLGRFNLIDDEDPAAFFELAHSILEEHNPQSDTEFRLAESIAQHYWLMQRAIRLQGENLGNDKKLALFLRYQTTHERSYYKAQKELLNLQKQRNKEQIGFESQNQKQEAHEAKVRLTHARAQNLEIDTACRQVMEAPLPGNCKISFEQIAHACSIAISSLVSQQQAAQATS